MTGLIAQPFRGGRGGWRAETTVPLAEAREDGTQRMLRISTYKHDRGGIVTYASACTKDGPVIRTAVFQDFHAVVEQRTAARGTERAIREQQQRALDKVEDLKAQALAHENTPRDRLP